MGYSIINYGTFCPNHPANKQGGNKKKSKFKVGDYYYPATETEPSIITPEKIEGRDPTGICVIPDGVVGEDAVFISVESRDGEIYYSSLWMAPNTVLVATDFIFNNDDVNSHDNSRLPDTYVKITPKRIAEKIVVQNRNSYDLMEVLNSCKTGYDDDYKGAYIPINGEYNENAKEHQKVPLDQSLWNSVDDQILSYNNDDLDYFQDFVDLQSSPITVYLNNDKYQEGSGHPLWYDANCTFMLWFSDNTCKSSYTTPYLIAIMLQYKDEWPENLQKLFISDKDVKWIKTGIPYTVDWKDCDGVTYSNTESRYWAFNANTGYVGTLRIDSVGFPPQIEYVDKNGNIKNTTSCFEELVQNRVPKLLIDTYNGFTIRYTKQWGETMILNLNEADEKVVGFELKLAQSVNPEDLKITMYTVTPNNPNGGNNRKTQISSDRIYSNTITMNFDSIKPQWVTLQIRKSGLSTDQYLDVNIEELYAVTEDGKKIPCYPCWMHDAGVKINWDLSNEIFDYEPSDKLYLTEEFFPDANFRAALAEELGISEGDEITEAKIAATTSLDVSSKQIANLTGIEHFTALEILYCGRNQLPTLDVSKNTILTELSCVVNQLTSLDVSKNTALTKLYCYDNQLTSLDVTGCTALIELWCNENQLTALDVSKNTALTLLWCYDNQLTELDISNNTILKTLYCSSNQLTSLNILSNKLNFLNCTINIISGEGMTTLVESLPQVTSGRFYAVSNIDDRNTITQEQIDIAKAKGWTVYVNGRTRSPLIGVERFDEEELRKQQEEEERFNRN